MTKTRRLLSIKMPFIGNSFMQRNDPPGLLAQRATARDLCFQHQLIYDYVVQIGVVVKLRIVPRFRP